MKEIRFSVDNEVYEKLREEAEKKNTSVKELISEILKQYFTRGFDLESVAKTKIITVKIPTICIVCKRRIHNETGLWIKGVGVICKHCLLQHVKDKMTQRDYSKLMLKLEVELERLKALKSELQKEVKSLIRKYYILSQMDIIERINEQIQEITSLLRYLGFSGEENTKLYDQLSRIADNLDALRVEVTKRVIPKEWIKKTMKEVGLTEEELVKQTVKAKI